MQVVAQSENDFWNSIKRFETDIKQQINPLNVLVFEEYFQFIYELISKSKYCYCHNLQTRAWTFLFLGRQMFRSIVKENN